MTLIRESWLSLVAWIKNISEVSDFLIQSDPELNFKLTSLKF